MLLRRSDLVVLAAPLVVGTVLGLLRRPVARPDIDLTASADSLLEGQATSAAVSLSSADTLDVLAVELRVGRGFVGLSGRPERCVTLGPGERRDVTLDLRSIRWGRQQVGPAIVHAVGAHGLLRQGPWVSGVVTATTLPLREGFMATDTVPHAQGVVGLHRSRRPGEGTELTGVRAFNVGDRLHRIHWPVSLRTGELHVTATLSDRDTDVTLVLDTRYDIGISDGIDGAASSLDITVRAAASVAEHYLRHGDRVGLIDLGQAIRQVRPGGGRAHLVRLLDVLLDAQPARGSGLTANVALSEVAPGSLVLLLSPLVGENALSRAAALGRAGHAVLVVDTLPADARPPRRSEWTQLAWRVWLLEREVDVARLAELGVPVVPWRGAGSLDQVLQDVSRAAAAPKALR